MLSYEIVLWNREREIKSSDFVLKCWTNDEQQKENILNVQIIYLIEIFSRIHS